MTKLEEMLTKGLLRMAELAKADEDIKAKDMLTFLETLKVHQQATEAQIRKEVLQEIIRKLEGELHD